MFKKIALVSVLLVTPMLSQAKSVDTQTKKEACATYADIAYNTTYLKERGYDKEFLIDQVKQVAPEDKTTPDLIKLIYKEIPKGADPEAVRKVTFEICME